jgi:hypothetical protein
MRDAANYIKDLSNKIKIRGINENVANFKQEMRQLVRHVAVFATLFDFSVKQCREDDPFQLGRSIASLFQFLLSLDDYSVRVIFEQYVTPDSSEEIGDLLVNKCFKTQKSKVRECTSQYFNFELYDTKGMCGLVLVN